MQFLHKFSNRGTGVITDEFVGFIWDNQPNYYRRVSLNLYLLTTWMGTFPRASWWQKRGLYAKRARS